VRVSEASGTSSSSDHLGGRAGEFELLTGFLDWNRAVVANKVRGLSLPDASRVMTLTGLSPLGVVAHLAAVEVGWFAESFAGEPVDPMWETHGSFLLTDDDTVSSVLEEYEASCTRSRRIVDAAPSFDALSVEAHEVWGQVSLRWVLMHMVEETARHAGHLDLMRETIDGSTG
jgi:Protein of unknown function (DUF664)